MNRIPVMRPTAMGREMAYLKEVIESGWWTVGPMTERFEEAFAEFLDLRHPPFVVATSSGTMALQIALKLLDVGEGDEVIVPSLTFVATAFAPMYLGARVVFADVDENTLCLDPEDVKRRITERTKAIILVHYAGLPGPAQELAELGVPLVEDCAHAAGAGWYFGGVFRGVGLDGVGAYSFHPVKPLATGDGGAVIVRDASLAERARRLRWFGVDKSTWEREGRHYRWDYTVGETGFKGYMNDICAAVALAQLERLEHMRHFRKTIADRYCEALNGHPKIKPAQGTRGAQVHAWGMFVVRCKERDRLHEFLDERGISSSVHYRPLHHHPVFEEQRDVDLPVTEEVWRELLSLPCYAGMSYEELTRVCKALVEFGNE